jgi:hypothetical protein
MKNKCGNGLGDLYADGVSTRARHPASTIVSPTYPPMDSIGSRRDLHAGFDGASGVWSHARRGRSLWQNMRALGSSKVSVSSLLILFPRRFEPLSGHLGLPFVLWVTGGTPGLRVCADTSSRARKWMMPRRRPTACACDGCCVSAACRVRQETNLAKVLARCSELQQRVTCRNGVSEKVKWGADDAGESTLLQNSHE